MVMVVGSSVDPRNPRAGRTGNRYTIPTRDTTGRLMPLPLVRQHVQQFLSYATLEPESWFLVTGLRGFSDDDAAPLFALAPANCVLPPSWTPYLRTTVQ